MSQFLFFLPFSEFRLREQKQIGFIDADKIPSSFECDFLLGELFKTETPSRCPSSTILFLMTFGIG